MELNKDIKNYNDSQENQDREICSLLAKEICTILSEAENKIWHGHPVWFLDGNPIVGYAKRKNDVQLLFWSGQSFKEDGLVTEGTFKAAQKKINTVDDINIEDLHRWLIKSRDIQWDYKNIVKRRGILERIK